MQATGAVPGRERRQRAAAIHDAHARVAEVTRNTPQLMAAGLLAHPELASRLHDLRGIVQALLRSGLRSELERLVACRRLSKRARTVVASVLLNGLFEVIH